MTIIASQPKKSEYELTPQGQFAALCYQVIDLGTQPSTDPTKSPSRKVSIAFELHGENLLGDGTAYMGDGKPFTIRTKFTISLAEKSNLRPFLEGWRGKAFTPEELEAFDLSRLVGAPATITVAHKPSKDSKKTYANIQSITPLNKTLPKPLLFNKTILFEIEPWVQTNFDGLPEWIRKQVEQSAEYKARYDQSINGPFGDE